MSWIMGTLAVGAILAAVSMSVAGYRSTPRANGAAPPPVTAAAGEDDPLAPRLFDKSGSIRVHVAGAVKKPGVYSLPSWARVVDAMKRAGGPSAAADLDAINLADFVQDGEQLRIPERGRRIRLQAHLPTPEPPPLDRTVGGRGTGRYPFAQLASTNGGFGQGVRAVDLNTATRQQLEALPGIGPATAERILAYRQANGRFLRPEDLMNVTGIGERRFERLRPFIAVQ